MLPLNSFASHFQKKIKAIGVIVVGAGVEGMVVLISRAVLSLVD